MGRSGLQPEMKLAWPRRGAATELNTTRVIDEPGEHYKELGHSSALAVQEAYYGQTQGLAPDAPQKALQAKMSNVQGRKMSLRSTRSLSQGPYQASINNNEDEANQSGRRHLRSQCKILSVKESIE